MTYAGRPLAFAGGRDSPGSETRVEIWYLHNPGANDPPVGTASIVAVISSAEKVAGGAVSYTGVSAASPLGPFVSNGGQLLPPGILSLLGSNSNQVWVSALATTGNVNSATPGLGQTERWETESGNGGSDSHGAGSTRPGGPLVDITWTMDNSEPWALGAVLLNPEC
jgi:hypothetical protein